MWHYHTEGFMGSAVKWSSHEDTRLAVASSSNYGLVGNGQLWMMELTDQGIVPQSRFLTQDALCDLAWSEIHHDQVVVASGDGSIKLFDAKVPQFPVALWKDHAREVLSVNWNMVTKDTFVSSSWDGTVKIWSPEHQRPLRSLPTHSCTYSADFSPHDTNLVSCVASDSLLRLYDLRSPASANNHLVLQLPIHGYQPPSEALSHDWNKYRPTVIATAGVDRAIRTFDIRAPQQGPLSLMFGHEYAVRKVAWSPHVSCLLLSASYDMSCRVWGDGSDSQLANAAIPLRGEECAQMNTHSEFVMSADWCLFGKQGWIASVGWDQNLYVWDVERFARNR